MFPVRAFRLPHGIVQAPGEDGLLLWHYSLVLSSQQGPAVIPSPVPMGSQEHVLRDSSTATSG